MRVYKLFGLAPSKIHCGLVDAPGKIQTPLHKIRDSAMTRDSDCDTSGAFARVLAPHVPLVSARFAPACV